jgi:hypothetical protein
MELICLWILDAKGWVEQITGIPQPALHLIVGSFVFLAVLAILRRPGTALLVVAMLEAVNEINDLRQYLPLIPASAVKETVYDVFWTMLVPCAIALASRISTARKA